MAEQITTAEELDALPEAFVVEFEYRSDDGMRIVGTFPTHEAARGWLHAAPICDYEASVVPIQVDRDLLAGARAEGARGARQYLADQGMPAARIVLDEYIDRLVRAEQTGGASVTPARELALRYLIEAREDHRDIEPPYKAGWKTFHAAAQRAARLTAYRMTAGYGDPQETADAWNLLDTAAGRVIERRTRDSRAGGA